MNVVQPIEETKSETPVTESAAAHVRSERVVVLPANRDLNCKP